MDRRAEPGLRTGLPRLTYPEPGVALITLSRPEVLNALRPEDVQVLIGHVSRCADGERARAVVITGEGRAFCSGGDVRVLRALPPTDTQTYLASYRDLAEAISSLPAPVIAAVNGLAYGGGLELMCMADMRVADTHATLCAADLPLGLVPTGGLTWRLPRLVGHGRASWMLLSNAAVGAADGRRMGLCDVVAESGRALEDALMLAQSIAACPPKGVEATKRALRMGESASLADSTSFEVDVNQGLLWEAETRRRLSDAVD